jgi:hypothetical protein
VSEWLDLQDEYRAIDAEKPCKRLPDPGDLYVHDWAYETVQRAHSAREQASKSYPPADTVWPDDRPYVRADGSLTFLGQSFLEELW